MKNLFQLPGACLALHDSYFSTAESDRLYALLRERINWQQRRIRLFGKWVEEPRLTAWHGDPGAVYTYSGLTMKPQPWTADLNRIRGCVEQEAGQGFNGVLLNLYRNGKDYMGWHQDNEKELGPDPVIGSVSFGETRELQLCHTEEGYCLTLALSHGSLLVMMPPTQRCWRHRIPKQVRRLGARINLTFRAIQ